MHKFDITIYSNILMKINYIRNDLHIYVQLLHMVECDSLEALAFHGNVASLNNGMMMRKSSFGFVKNLQVGNRFILQINQGQQVK